MTLLPLLCRLAVLACLVSGCVASTGSAPGEVTPNAVAGDAIEVTALDAPTASPAPEAAAAGPQAPTQSATPTAVDGTVDGPAPIPTDATAAQTGAAAETGAATGPAAESPIAAAPVVPPKSDRQIACERKKGIWASTDGGLNICVRTTRDSGKRCTREGQCEGVCLARSGTCAPADPLLGCNEVLQEDGSRATVCIE